MPNAPSAKRGSPAPNRLQGAAAKVAAFAAARSRSVLVGSLIVAIVACVLAARLTVAGDFSRLLPPNAVAVLHLRALEKRTRVLADYLVGIEAADRATREAAARAFRAQIDRIEPGLVAGVVADRRVAHEYAWKHRYLFAPTNDLEAARTALERAIDRANPMRLDLGDDSPDVDAGDALAKLERQIEKARAEAADPGEIVSDDGRLQLFIVRTTFTSDDTARGDALTGMLMRAAKMTEAEHPGVTVGMTGDVITSNAEHHALLRGMLASTAVTVVLVVGALFWFFRSALGVLAVAWSLFVGVVSTFAFTSLTIGHLNLASAFLSSIVIGNGINFGLILLSRYLEERRAAQPVDDAIARAAAGSAPGTLTAALAASVAYGSLAVTQFRGFRDFGIIGAAGMLFCWISAYTVLPAGLSWLGPRVRAADDRRLGRVFSRIVPSRAGPVAAAFAVFLVATSLLAVRYVTHDPFEDDLRNLRSYTAELDESSRWMQKFDRAFGNGISGGFAIGVASRRDAAAVEAKLKAADRGKPIAQHLFSQISSLDDLLPPDQAHKLEVLADIRRMIDSRAVRHLPSADRERLLAVRPPDDLGPVTDADVPADLAWPYTERDGTRGRLILANTGLGVDMWRVHDLESFARAIRGMDLGTDVVVGGSAFVFTDMLAMMKIDGPRATLAALVGSALVVLVLLGAGRHGRVSLACAGLGTTAMLSAAWAMGIKVNFLDFVALPITIGIGIDYSVNIAARAKQFRSERSGHDALGTTGPAVALCSYTTIVGYASLLFSQNRGIHTFGLSAMIGELTCLSAAVIFAPALLDLPARNVLKNPSPPETNMEVAPSATHRDSRRSID